MGGESRRKAEELSFRYEQTLKLRVRWRRGVSGCRSSVRTAGGLCVSQEGPDSACVERGRMSGRVVASAPSPSGPGLGPSLSGFRTSLLIAPAFLLWSLCSVLPPANLLK